ncbi:MAG: hypothetical protein M1828_007622 [Chrysothrix sp. TS-e1954]|nr:MAG: hypothetical protein M1828_007622 [Chrysothrix sp. TS-e1954]
MLLRQLETPFKADFCLAPDDLFDDCYSNPEVPTLQPFSNTSSFGLSLDESSSETSSHDYMSQAAFNRSNASLGTKQYLNTSVPRYYNEQAQTFVPSRSWNNQDSGQDSQIHDFAIEQGLQPETAYPWWQMPSHERAVSNGSMPSHASLSPYSASSALQYPSTVNATHSQQLAPHQSSSTPSTPLQNLPTPTRTPTQDAMSWSNPRRTADPAKVDAAKASHQAFRGHSGTQPPSQRSSSRHGGGSASIYSQDLPITPKTANGDEYDVQFNGTASGETALNDYDWWPRDMLIDEPVATRHFPKLDCTMSDIYQDELYDPRNSSSAPVTGQVPAYSTQFLSPNQPNMVVQRLQQANQARNGMPQPQRQVSPYRQHSAWANSNDFSTSQHRMQTAAGLREQQKAENDAIVYRQHHPQREDTEPNTISPKDAFPMEINPGEEELPSLFPNSSQQSGNGDSNGFGRGNPPSSSQFNFSVPASSVSFATPSMPASASIPETRIPQYRPESSNSVEQEPMSFPAALPSMETTRSDVGDDYSQDESSSSPETLHRPSGTTASAGTYSCTYKGCSRRFESPPQLQKHKREDHRTTGTIIHEQEDAATSAMTQAGPHKCTRKNPATGRPCNTVFSRPYDLTRHEDTIHAKRKKVRCPHCTEEKLFSRADALTRHLRVVHPHVSFPTKHRKRAID